MLNVQIGFCWPHIKQSQKENIIHLWGQQCHVYFYLLFRIWAKCIDYCRVRKEKQVKKGKARQKPYKLKCLHLPKNNEFLVGWGFFWCPSSLAPSFLSLWLACFILLVSRQFRRIRRIWKNIRNQTSFLKNSKAWENGFKYWLRMRLLRDSRNSGISLLWAGSALNDYSYERKIQKCFC